MTAASTPAPPAGSGLPILGQLSPIARVFLLGTVAVSIVAIVLDFGLHVDETVLFLVSAAGILGLAWVVGLSTERLGSLTGPAGRRHPQRDVRQHRRADHRVLRAPGRAHRGREGVDHRLDHRQPAARARRERARRRASPRDADVQPADRRRRTRRSWSWRPSGCSCPRSSRSRADPARGRVTEESVLVVGRADRRLRALARLPVHEPGPDARRPRRAGGPWRPGCGAVASAVVVLLARGRAARRAVGDPRELDRRRSSSRSG